MSIDFSYFLHVYVNFRSTCCQCVSFLKFTIIITTKHSQQTSADILNVYKHYNTERTYVLQLFCILKTKWVLSYANRICEDVPSRKRSGEDIYVKGGKLTRKILVKECDMFSILRRVFTHGKRIRISQEAGCTWVDFLQGIDYRRRVQQSKNSYYERIWCNNFYDSIAVHSLTFIFWIIV